MTTLPAGPPSMTDCAALGLAAFGLTAALVFALRWWRQALAVASTFSLAIAPFGVWMHAADFGLAQSRPAPDSLRPTPA